MTNNYFEHATHQDFLSILRRANDFYSPQKRQVLRGFYTVIPDEGWVRKTFLNTLLSSFEASKYSIYLKREILILCMQAILSSSSKVLKPFLKTILTSREDILNVSQATRARKTIAPESISAYQFTYLDIKKVNEFKTAFNKGNKTYLQTFDPLNMMLTSKRNIFGYS